MGKFQQAQRLPRSGQSIGPRALQSQEDSKCLLSHGNRSVHFIQAPCRRGLLNRNHKKKQGIYKATAYVLKGGFAQRACRHDQSDTTTIPRRGAPLPASGGPVPNSSASHVVAYAPQIFGLHSSKASRCIKGNHLLAFHNLTECVREGGTTRQGHMGSCLICLMIVFVLPDFAVSPASKIASHIRVTSMFLHCVSSAARCRKMFNNWGTLLSPPLCYALLCCPASFSVISKDASNLMVRTSKLVMQSSTSPILAVTSLQISAHAATPCWPPITHRAPTEYNKLAHHTGQAT